MSKLTEFRKVLKSSQLDGYLVPMSDPFQNEFVPAAYRRLEWLTGFTGSAGFLIITDKEAILFVDGRYTIQAELEVSQKDFSIQAYTIANISNTLEKYAGKKIGFDPWTLTYREFEALNKTAEKNSLLLLPTKDNLIDHIWCDRPSSPKEPIVDHPLKYAGVSSQDKREKLIKILKEKNVDGVFLSRLDSIAWLLNLRGSDVEHTPLFLSYAYMDVQGYVVLFCNKNTIDCEIKLKNVVYKNLDQVGDFLHSLDNKKILLDVQKTPYAITTFFKEEKIIFDVDPCQLPKAIANSTEQEGARNCQIRDGIALTKFLYWIDQCALKEKADEYDAMEKILSLRKEQSLFKDLSFGTIAAIDKNAVLAHYRTADEKNKKFTDGCVFLCDSGGQYLDGTTDTTRTVWVGNTPPPPELKDHYTRVLKGHIAIATASFPQGTSGMQLDSLARQFLWEVGLDYAHGTGHGVGCYLGVHDGPQGISKHYSAVPLVPGMLLSNEPGYYKKDHYGIRLENVVMVNSEAIYKSDYPMYGFETITCVPFDAKLVNFDLLSNKEKDWLKKYHLLIEENISKYLDEKERKWLKDICNDFVQ